MNQHPEIIAAPYTVWTAPVGTPFPAIDEAPGEPWALLGSNGDRNYASGGVTVAQARQYASSTPAAATGSSTSWIEGDGLRVQLDLLDLTLEQYAMVLGQNVVNTTPASPGIAGIKTIGLAVPTGRVAEFAVLARGPSPYAEGMAAQYELPRCHEAGSPQLVFRKGIPAGLTVELMALEDPLATSEETRFGRLVAQFEAAGPGSPVPLFTALPQISGTPQVGQTLTGTDGVVSFGAVSARQFERDETPIAGATGSDHLLTIDDLGASIRFTNEATGPGGMASAASASLGPVTSAAATPLFASLRLPPENGENKAASGANGGIYLPGSTDLMTVSAARDTPFWAGPSAMAVLWRRPREIYDGTRRVPTIIGNLRPRVTSTRMMNISYVSGAEVNDAANVGKFLCRLIGETAGGTALFYSAAVPAAFGEWLAIVPVTDGTNFRCDVIDLLTGAVETGPSTAKPGAWAGMDRFTGDVGIGICGQSTALTLPGTFPIDGGDVGGKRNIPYARGEFGGVLFLDSAGTAGEWEDFALGGDPITIWPGAVRAWYPLTSAGAVDLAPRKNRASNVIIGAAATLGTVLPGSPARRQTEAKFLQVKDMPDPAVSNLRRATINPAAPGAARGTFRAVLAMAGQTAGLNIEAQVWRRSDNAIIRDWTVVGVTVATGDVPVTIDLPGGIFRGRFRIAGGGDQCELNSDISNGFGVVGNGQSQHRYTFGLGFAEQGENTVLNTQFDAGVGERTFVLGLSNTSGLQKPAIYRAALCPGLVGDGIIAYANTIAASPDFPADWPIHIIDVSVSGTTIEDTLEEGGAPDDRDMADIYAITDMLRGRTAANKAIITAWRQFWHSGGSVENYAQTFMPPMLDGTATGNIDPDDWFRSDVAIDPDFLFLHTEPNRIIASVLGAASNTDSRTEHLVRKNLRDQEPNYDYTLIAPCDVHRLDGNVFTHPDQNQLLGAPLVARIMAKSELAAFGFAGGWQGPVAITAAQFTDGARTAINVTFTGPAGFALGVLNAGAITGFEVANDKSTFTAAIIASNVVRLTKTSGSWAAATPIELKPGGPGDYGTGHDEAAFVNGALINTADGMLVRGTGGPVVVADA